MDRCPNCRARVSGEDHCRRCGMALDLLYQVEESADAQLAQALHQLANGNSDAASAALRRLLSLRRDPLAEQLLAFAEENRTSPKHELDGVQQYSMSNAPVVLPNGYYVTD